MDFSERAKEIAQGNVKQIRYKTLTFEQLKKWGDVHDRGKKGEDNWNSGERVFAFEDGTVNFKEGGGMIQNAFKDPSQLSKWIAFLDGFSKEWE